MKDFLLSAVLGFAALALVNLCGDYTGVLVPLNRLSIGAAGLLGVPGVTLLVLLNALLWRAGLADGKREDVSNAAHSCQLSG